MELRVADCVAGRMDAPGADGVGGEGAKELGGEGDEREEDRDDEEEPELNFFAEHNLQLLNALGMGERQSAKKKRKKAGLATTISLTDWRRSPGFVVVAMDHGRTMIECTATPGSKKWVWAKLKGFMAEGGLAWSVVLPDGAPSKMACGVESIHGRMLLLDLKSGKTQDDENRHEDCLLVPRGGLAPETEIHFRLSFSDRKMLVRCPTAGVASTTKALWRPMFRLASRAAYVPVFGFSLPGQRIIVSPFEATQPQQAVTE